MAMKTGKLYPLTIAVSAMILAVFLAVQVGYAGGAAAIVPVDDRDVPDGSFISEQRIKKIEIEVQKFKAERKRKAKEQRQNRSSQSETPTPENPKEK